MKAILSVIIAASAATAWGGVLSPGLAIEAERASRVRSVATVSSEVIYTSLIVEATDEAIEAIENLGGVVFSHRDNLATVCIPRHSLSALDGIEGISRTSGTRFMDSKLDKALSVSHAVQLHAGEVSGLELTGRGVVAGFTDCGFDVTHPAFEGRVAGFYHFNDTLATCSTPIETDNAHQFHATHVAGILAGDAAGTPYGGVAPGATILATTSILHDAGILAGVEKVIEYAKANNMPAVVNLSIGSNIGSHDGTDLFTRYLDLCARDAVIVLSAGNNGTDKGYIHHDFTTTNPMVETMIYDSAKWSDFDISGLIDGWSCTDAPIKVRLRVWDGYEKEYVYTSSTIEANEATGVITLQTIDDIRLAKYYKGSVMVAGGIDPGNGKFNLMVEYDMHTTTKFPGAEWARYNLIFDFFGDDGTGADLYIDDTHTQFLRHNYNTTAVNGNATRSISSLACGFNTISVGMANTRDTSPNIGGGTDSWPYPAGANNEHSSYGTLEDGRQMPHINAPGSMIVAPSSKGYAAENPTLMAYRSPAGGYYKAECGTSMSSPHAAGVFALWLEADPTLTPSEIRRIAMETASMECCDPENPRTGAGMIDAVAGLRKILNNSGIALPDADRIIMRRIDGRLAVDHPAELPCQVEIYDITGRRISPDQLPSSPIIVRARIGSDVVVRKL